MSLRPLWIGLLALALLAPLGIWLPQRFRAGPAWGEWSPQEVKRITGHLPEGMERISDFWRAPLPDYAPSSLHPSVGYLVSGLLGLAATVALALLLGRALRPTKTEKDTAGHG